MFELRDLPSYATLAAFGKTYGNPDVAGLQTWLIWASATSEMLAAFEANLGRFGVSQTQFFVLLLLKRNMAGLSVGALAEGVSVTSQTMTRVIDRMESGALCSKTSDPSDRRAWIVRILPAGDELLATVLPNHYEWVAQLMGRFDAAERKALVQIMLKLR